MHKDKRFEEDPYYFSNDSAFEEEKEDPYEKRKQEIIALYKLNDFDVFRIETYLKVGLFCNMSPAEFEREEQWKIDYLDNEIDRRFSTNDFGKKAEKPQLSVNGKSPEPINYLHSALILSLARLFSGDDDKKKTTKSRR